MNELHLFAGAGGGILGGILCGHTCVCAVEIEPYCRTVVLQRQRDGMLPRFPIWDDVRTFDGRPWRGLVDVVCGGFPCQDISAAGKGAGITGERSGLWGEMARIISEVRPRFAFVENSPLLIQRGLSRVLADFAEMGMDARWGIVSAEHAGFPHERKRIWIYANADKNNDSRRRLTNGSGQEKQKRIFAQNSKNESDWFGTLAALDGIPSSATYADCRRVVYGLANGMDRLGAIGNGQVPAVVKLAWEILSGESR